MSQVEAGTLALTDTDSEVAVRSIGQWSLIWRRFTRHRLALIGGIVLLAVIALAVIGPFIAPPLTVQGKVNAAQIGINYGKPPRLVPFSLARLLGTTSDAFPVSTYVLEGGQVTLVIGFLGAFIASILGIMIGGVAGYYGRIADAVMMRITDAALTIPFLPLLFLLGFYLPTRTTLTYAILFGLVGWGGVARLVRGYILSLRRREFAEAARALGVSDTGIIIRHLLPNALDVIIVSFTLNVATFILTEAALEYVGGPVTANGTTWASIMTISYIDNNWWQVVFPAIPLLAAVLAINVIGDGLRDAFDTTGSGALLRWRDPTARPGLLRRAFAPAAVPLRATGRGAAAVWERRPSRRRGWAIPAADEPVFLLRLSRRLEQLPLTLRLLPIVAVLVVGGIVTLFSHSPLRYAAHFTSPQPVFTAYSSSEYGAHLRGGGGWDVLTAGAGGRLTFVMTGRHGREHRRQTFSAGSNPSLVYGHGRALGVWLDPNSDTVKAAYLGQGNVTPFSLVPSTGATDHPVVLAVPGGYDVIFQWQPHPGTGPEYQIYLAFIPTGAHRPALVRRIAASPDYGFYPRAVADGSGSVDVLWLDRFKINTWAFRFRRFRPDGMPLSARHTVGFMCYACKSLDNIVPSRWNVTMARAKDGSVWAVFEEGENGTGTYLDLAHWSRRGKILLPPTPLPVGFDASPNGGIALALLPHGGQLYYAGANPDGGVGSVTFMQAFNAHGSPIGLPQRVNYDADGSSALPHAGTLHGIPHVLWQRVRAGPTYLETSTYHVSRTPPTLLVRLGLNIGGLPLNLVLLVIGGIAGGAAVALADSALVILLLLLWLPIRWVILGPLRPLRWPLFLLVVAAVLVAVFGTRPDPPAWVPLIGGLGFRTRWVAVAGAIIVAVWTCFALARRTESIFRAALTAFAGVYVVAVMYAVIFIQSEITRI